MPTEIRRLSIADYEAIISLWGDAGLPCKPLGRDSREMMAKEMAMPQCAFFGLFDGERMLALGIANFDGRRGWVNRVAVDPDHRGRRLAAEIMRECEQFLREQGAVVMCALIEEINGPSITCFQNAGYVCEPPIRYFTKRRSADD